MIEIYLIKYLTIGSLLGLTAGISPGPLLALAITETLAHGKKEGFKIAISPLITDFPIIAVIFFFISKISKYSIIISVISFAGAIFMAYLGYGSIKTEGLKTDEAISKSKSMTKGVIANFLSPHPYLFWLTIGAPILIKAYEIHIMILIIFLTSFYVLLIGSKIAIVMAVEHSRTFLSDLLYIRVVRAMGVALFLFSILFIYDGIKLLLSP